jgi:hypothetical protein
MMSISPQQQNEAEAHARLDLLSSASLLKNVMDKSQTKKDSSSPSCSKENDGNHGDAMDSNFTPPKCKGRNDNRRNSSASAVTLTAGESTSGSAAPNSAPVEKSSSESPATVIASSTSFPPTTSSYAALLTGRTPVGYYHYQQQQQQQLSHQLSALAHLPHFQKSAVAMIANANHTGAFHKPFATAAPVPRMTNSKENVPPFFRSVTQHQQQQSPGEGREQQQQQGGAFHNTATGSTSTNTFSYQVILAENMRLKEELKEKEMAMKTLQTKADGLEKQIGELRQLPTGKISHIPVE